MLDLIMIAILAAAYALFAGFMAWCGTVVEDSGGERS
ncbi:MAG: hypothetical protein K0Q59_6003 [Paenibacillus sp.]|jgi:hypothetical protein|nr:hypothetical protein [Paenibacillus sp.]